MVIQKQLLFKYEGKHNLLLESRREKYLNHLSFLIYNTISRNLLDFMAAK